jgi:hypothetical protein
MYFYVSFEFERAINTANKLGEAFKFLLSEKEKKEQEDEERKRMGKLLMEKIKEIEQERIRLSDE